MLSAASVSLYRPIHSLRHWHAANLQASKTVQPLHVNLFMFPHGRYLHDANRIEAFSSNVSYVDRHFVHYKLLADLFWIELKLKSNFHYVFLPTRMPFIARFWVERSMQEATTRPEVSETKRVGRRMDMELPEGHYAYSLLTTHSNILRECIFSHVMPCSLVKSLRIFRRDVLPPSWR